MRPAALLLAAALLVLPGCRPKEPPRPHPIVLVGIDGGEWKVIHKLWSQGKLLHLRAIADRGVTATLRTAYNSSPVIWTTIATGVTPREHGIVDFVVPTPQGDVPISSDVRKVPAIWNMLTQAKRRVNVFGWWGSWPAEEINGVVVTDRALLDLERRVSPASYLPAFQEEVRRARQEPSLFGADDEAEMRDRAIARAAVTLAGKPFDLHLVYFRSPDIISHNYWKDYEPDDPRELTENRDRVPRSYEAVDQALGRILDAAPKDSNVLVISDHGFHAAKPEEVKVLLNMDAVLERLGYQTRVYTYGTPSFRQVKLMRFSLAGREKGGRARPAEREALMKQLAADLKEVTYESGAPALTLREARGREVREGADFAVVVQLERVSPTLRFRGERIEGAIESVSRISGTHTRNTHGIFLAAGPDIDPVAKLEGIRVHDITPTLLYGLGLPVAENFAGKARTDLFTAAFREAHPLRTIRTWGTRRSAGARTSKEDEKLLEELRALGYIN
ncbi:MAG TPA: alkaline phosphatase family protein [Thermoanaerobaculia bacterium]|nr:alkaline phosphatase family protein [Thermoanaerobaculia bacterium]